MLRRVYDRSRLSTGVRGTLLLAGYVVVLAAASVGMLALSPLLGWHLGT